MENFEGKIPIIGMLLNDEEVLKKLMEAKQNNQLSNFCLRSLKKQVSEERSTQLRDLLSLQGVGADYKAKKDFVLREYKQDRSTGAIHIQRGEQLEVSIYHL